MRLSKRFAHEGNWLFRWRSYIPFAMLPLLLATVWNFSYPGGSETLDHLLEIVCLSVAGLGFAIRAHAIGHATRHASGANTRRQVAEELNTTGLYSVVRHPLYLGNALVWLGIALYSFNLLTIATAVLFFAFYYERIMVAEEEFLAARFGPRFTTWAQATPAFIPNFRRWVPPSRGFDWRAVVRRDYGAVFAVFTTIEVGGDWAMGERPHMDPAWAILFFSALAYFVVVFSLKKGTSLLRSRR